LCDDGVSKTLKTLTGRLDGRLCSPVFNRVDDLFVGSLKHQNQVSIGDFFTLFIDLSKQVRLDIIILNSLDCISSVIADRDHGLQVAACLLRLQGLSATLGKLLRMHNQLFAALIGQRLLSRRWNNVADDLLRARAELLVSIQLPVEGEESFLEAVLHDLSFARGLGDFSLHLSDEVFDTDGATARQCLAHDVVRDPAPRRMRPRCLLLTHYLQLQLS